MGYASEAVRDGRQAVDRVLAQRYGLVLMDCQMPVMDGLAATREIRAREQGQRTPIVALTAGALHSDETNCLEAGMDGFIPKPIDLAKLAEVLAKGLGCGLATAARRPGITMSGPRPSRSVDTIAVR
jgi:CheY-like chemotaxis protein